MTAPITAALIGVLLAGSILFLVRRDHLHGSFALWWFAVAVAILVLGLFPPVIDWLGSITGIYYPPILPIVIGIGMILIRLLKMDVDRSRSERQMRRLTQKLAILEQELREARRPSEYRTSRRNRPSILLLKLSAPSVAADVAMRVLHIGKFFPPHPGGIERTSADLCAGLAAKNVEIAMLAHAEPGEVRSTLTNADRVAVTRAACFGQWLYAPISPTFPLLLKKILSDFQPDILHLHLPNTSAFWALLSSAAKHIPWVVHWHGDIPLDSSRAGLRFAYGIYRPWEQALLRRSAAIIANVAGLCGFE